MSHIFGKVSSYIKALKVNLGKYDFVEVIKSQEKSFGIVLILDEECTCWEVLLELFPEFLEINFRELIDGP